MHSHNTLQVKKINVELVKNTLKAAGTGTKASIAGLTKLSVATCGTILNELAAAGEVIELEPDESHGGRPAKQYRYNSNFGYAVCVLVRAEGGRFWIRCSVVNLSGEPVKTETLHLETIGMETIDSLIDRFITEFGNVQAIGIGIPGIVHRGKIGVCDVPELAGAPLGPYLEEKYGMEITIENDMNMTVYGLYHLQRFEEDTTFAVVTFPANQFPGAGFIVNGGIVSGNTHFGGEVSFLPFGLTREEQLERLHTEDGFIPLAVNILSSVIVMINPAAIAITGELPREKQLDELYAGCLNYIPEEHMPALFIKNNTEDEYMTGLVTATLESLTYRLQLIARR